MSVEAKDNTAIFKSVDKALEVLEAFSEFNEGINLSSLSEKLNMNKSGVYRILQAFKHRGYVEQKIKNGKYHLGMAAFMVGQNIVSNMEVTRTAKPIMERLVREYNETVYLALRCGEEVLLFDNVDSLHPVNVMSLKGRHYPLSDCAAGDILLAFGTTSAVDDLSKSFQGDARLATLRKQGYSTGTHQLGEGVVSIAVPLLDAEKLAFGSLCFVGPDFRLTDERIENSLLLPLIEAGHAISAKLGYFGYHIG